MPENKGVGGAPAQPSGGISPRQKERHLFPCSERKKERVGEFAGGVWVRWPEVEGGLGQGD